uniref:FHA domain-containing protein n=1 Tax=Trypanosoma congolense (strain IL3000) TaxID=1068625 RepID=G0UQD6_TRYCI|nr:conserved hypothetical protein [Trypanosoma congolense IL3000]
MWIVYVDGEPRYRLVGGALYTVGAKDCHITLSADASISRRHLTLEVGSLPLVDENQALDVAERKQTAPIVITDTSKYGTEVFSSSVDADGCDNTTDAMRKEIQLCDTVPLHVELSKDESFSVPSNSEAWREFSICVGAHGTTLQLRWTALRIFTIGYIEEQLLQWLNSCGVVTVSDVSQSDYLLTPHLTITPVALATLCRPSSYIVAPEYFKTLQEGRDVKPLRQLQDPSIFTPSIDDAWRALMGGIKSECLESGGTEACEENFMVQRLGELLFSSSYKETRQGLFAGLTFVVVQRSLYEQVKLFLPFTEGRVVLDLSLHAVASDEQRRSILQTFNEEHCHHVILYSNRERLPIRCFLRTLQSCMKMHCVEYMTVVRSIFLARALPAPLPSHCTSPPPGGEREHSEMGVEPLAEREKAADGVLHAQGQNRDSHQVPTVNQQGQEGYGCQTCEPRQRADEVCMRQVRGEDQQENDSKESVEEGGVDANCMAFGGLKGGVKRRRCDYTAEGRRTDPKPLFHEVTSDTDTESSGGDGTISGGSSTMCNSDTNGWIHSKSRASRLEEDNIAKKGPPLATCPCPDQRSAPPASDGASCGKWFKKQELLESNEKIELDRSVVHARKVSLLRRLSIDDVDIIPSAIGRSVGVDALALASRGLSSQQVLRFPQRCEDASGVKSDGCREPQRAPMWQEVEQVSRGGEMAAHRNNAPQGMSRAGSSALHPRLKGTPKSIFDLDTFF